MTDELVHLEVARGVGTITLDSPANRNALSQPLLEQFRAHFSTAQADTAVRVIVLTATGTVFCAGADMKEQLTVATGDSLRGPSLLALVLGEMWEASKPIVGRVNGLARGGGIGLIAACDLAVAVESATFAFSEVRVGVTPAVISVLVLRRVGRAACLELFLTGEPFDARRAAAIGLLNAVVPREDLDSTVDGYVASIRKGAPGALALAKRLVRDVPDVPVDEGLRRMAVMSEEIFASDEGREGMTAFSEKRPPRWLIP